VFVVTTSFISVNVQYIICAPTSTRDRHFVTFTAFFT